MLTHALFQSESDHDGSNDSSSDTGSDDQPRPKASEVNHRLFDSAPSVCTEETQATGGTGRVALDVVFFFKVVQINGVEKCVCTVCL